MSFYLGEDLITHKRWKIFVYVLYFGKKNLKYLNHYW